MTHHDGTRPGEHRIPEIEEDETVPPRPEEELADIARSEPDLAPHDEAHTG